MVAVALGVAVATTRVARFVLSVVIAKPGAIPTNAALHARAAQGLALRAVGPIVA
jgi:hypothetical protein